MKKNWYAVYTKITNERRVASFLSKKKFENYCPNNRIVQPNQSFKRKLDFEPLFPSFVFVYITEAEINSVKKVNFVIDFVYWLGKPAVIKEVEIENIRQFTRQHENIAIEKSNVYALGTTRIVNDTNINTALLITNSTIKLQLPSLGFTMVAQLTEQNTDALNYLYESGKLTI